MVGKPGVGDASDPEPLKDKLGGAGGLRTFTGRRFYPLKPKIEDVSIFDIAHALSNLCRFAGHVHEFYSVAQHSYLVSVEIMRTGDVEGAKWGLLHDAAEAYLVDVPSPLKRMAGFGDGYRAAEKKLLRVIARRLGLQGMIEPEIVRHFDHVLLCTEQRDLYGERETPYTPSYDVPMLEGRIVGWSPMLAEEMFLGQFMRLF